VAGAPDHDEYREIDATTDKGRSLDKRKMIDALFGPIRAALLLIRLYFIMAVDFDNVVA